MLAYEQTLKVLIYAFKEMLLSPVIYYYPARC